MNRRGFLKRLGLGVAAVAAVPVLPKIVTPTPTAPLYIPPERLDMGVPRAILTASEMPTPDYLIDQLGTRAVSAPPQWAGSVPMLLVHDEFQPPGWQQYGQQKVPAGTTLMVDRPTAERWITHGVGTPGQMAPLDLQQASAQRWAAKQVAEDDYDYDSPPGVEAFALFVGRPDVAPMNLRYVRGEPLTAAAARTRSDAFDRMVKRATATARGADASAWWNSIPEGSILVDRSMLAARCFPISAEDADATT